MDTTSSAGDRETLPTRPGNPFRAGDWRWQHAGRLCQAGLRPRRSDDAWVRQAWRLRRWLHSGKHPPSTDVRAAHAYFHEPTHLRAEIEARLLAEQSCDEIAAACTMPVELLAAFQALYFDFADRLSAASLILRCAVRQPDFGPPALAELASLWRRAAYFGGPAVLDALLEAFQALPTELQQRGARAFQDDPSPCGVWIRAQIGGAADAEHVGSQHAAGLDRLAEAFADRLAEPAASPTSDQGEAPPTLADWNRMAG